MKRLLVLMGCLCAAWGLLAKIDQHHPATYSGEYARVDTLATISSLQRLGNFWMMDYQGDYEYILQGISQEFLSHSARIPEEFGCSLFSATGDSNNFYFGRNFDNPNQDVLIARYNPPGQYASIALNRMSDLGYPLGTNYLALSANSKRHLLKAPFYAADGINECGLAAGLAYVPSVPIVQDPTKEYIYITLLQRKILDQAATCAEALAIANSYNVYDTSYTHTVVSHHILVTDIFGDSVILEYVNDQFVAIPTANPWQVLTNSPIYNVPNPNLMSECWRYGILYQSLADCTGEVNNWRLAMDILSQATWYGQGQGTQWSTIADLWQKGLYVAIDRDFENVAYLDIDSFACKNFGRIVIDDFTISDEDGDGLYEPGETLSIVLFITADFPTPVLSGILAAPLSDASINVSQCSFGSIAEDMLCTLNEIPFSLTLNSESDVDCIVTFHTTYGHEFTADFVIPVSPTSLSENTISTSVTALTCYPNPMKSEALISYVSEDASSLEICVYNVKGQKIRTLASGKHNPGKHEALWDGKDTQGKSVADGIYFVRLNSAKGAISKKLVVF